jgi:small-conductance mechanosensitive channel
MEQDKDPEDILRPVFVVIGAIALAAIVARVAIDLSPILATIVNKSTAGLLANAILAAVVASIIMTAKKTTGSKIVVGVSFAISVVLFGALLASIGLPPPIIVPVS